MYLFCIVCYHVCFLYKELYTSNIVHCAIFSVHVESDTRTCLLLYFHQSYYLYLLYTCGNVVHAIYSTLIIYHYKIYVFCILITGTILYIYI